MSDITINPEEFSINPEQQVIGYENLGEMIEFLINTVRNSPEFNRLEDKTQVIFTNGKRDDIRTRKTHTEDVARISEMLAAKFEYPNEMQRLSYLIGLCHDLGHTAFGHDGESRIDAALKFYEVSTEDFDERWYGEKEDFGETVYKKPEYSFEHHAHSVRVFKKILKDNNIELTDELYKDIHYGILSHSESRTKDHMVRNPFHALARYADKIYPYTDMLDILQSGIEINENILDEINQKTEYITDKDGQIIPFNDEDKKVLREILATLKEEKGIEEYAHKYVEGASWKESIGKDERGEEIKGTTCIASHEMQSQMKILKTIAKYLRQERKMGKEELLARAMVDEVIQYIVDHPRTPELPMVDRVYQASVLVTNLTDTELREWYRKISKDKEWQASRKIEKDYDVTQKSANARSKTFPILLTSSERQSLLEDPDRIIQAR